MLKNKYAFTKQNKKKMWVLFIIYKEPSSISLPKWGNSIERFDKILKYNLFYPFARFLPTTKFYTISLRQSEFQPFSNVYKQNTKIQQTEALEYSIFLARRLQVHY